VKTLIVYLRDLTADDKVAPQVKALMTTLASLTVTDPETKKSRPIAFGDKVERPKIVEALAAGDALTTRQTPDRILSFYQPKMKELGLIDVLKEAEPEKEKPAKAEKATPSKPGTKATPAAAKGEAVA
jgi:hypothetical protein